MDSEQEVLNIHYFSINEKFLKLICLWPYQKALTKRFWRIFNFLSVVTMVIPQVLFDDIKKIYF